MAEAEPRPEATHADQPVAAAKPAGLWRRLNLKWLVGTRTLATVALCSIALNVVGYGFIRARMFRTPPPPSPEITLGAFQFQGDEIDHSGIVSAQFSLHVSLLKEAERPGRAQLADAKFRLQQDIEELLRRAHGADFEDPTLAELKRQVQEQVNATLGVRAVSGVIITDLALRRGEPRAADANAEIHPPHAPEETSNRDNEEDVVQRQPKAAGSTPGPHINHAESN